MVQVAAAVAASLWAETSTGSYLWTYPVWGQTIGLPSTSRHFTPAPDNTDPTSVTFSLAFRAESKISAAVRNMLHIRQ